MEKKKKIASKSTRSTSVAKKSKTHEKSSEKWSADVTHHSHALDLEDHIFNQKSPQHIAESLKRSAEKSKTRKADSFQSAMSMLNFYINRAGKNLPAARKEILEKAKEKLRQLFGRTEASKS